MAQYIFMHPPSGTTSLSEKNGSGFGENDDLHAEGEADARARGANHGYDDYDAGFRDVSHFNRAFRVRLE